MVTPSHVKIDLAPMVPILGVKRSPLVQKNISMERHPKSLQLTTLLQIDELGNDWCKSMKQFSLIGNGDVANAIRLQEIMNTITQNAHFTKEAFDHQVELYEQVLTEAYIKASQGEKWVGFRHTDTMPQEKTWMPNIIDEEETQFQSDHDILGDFDSSWDDVEGGCMKWLNK